MSDEIPLTWGQQVSWWGHHAIPRSGRNHHNLCLVIEPRRVTLSKVAEQILRDLVIDNPALRTTFTANQRISPPPSQQEFRDRWLIRRVASSQEDVIAAGKSLWRELRDYVFDLAAEHPVKFGLLSTGGAVPQIFACFHHIVLDAQGLMCFERLFHESVEAAAGHLPGPRATGLTPGDIARQESSGELAAMNRSGLARWSAVAARMPARIYHRAPSREAVGERHAIYAYREDSAVDSAIDKITRQYRASYASVVFALFATALAVHSGHSTIPLGVQLSNRHFSELRSVLGSVTQKGIWLTDFHSDPTFQDVLKDTYRNLLVSMTCGRYGHFDHLRILHRESLRRGVLLWRGRGHGVQVNYADADSSATNERYYWQDDRDLDGGRGPVELGGEVSLRAVRGNGALKLKLVMEDGGPAAADLNDLLDIFSGLASQISQGKNPRFSEIPLLVKVKGFPREGLEYVENSWVSPAAVEQILCRIPMVRAAAVFCDGPPGERALSAHIAADAPLAAQFIRRRLLVAFKHYPSGVCPSRIRLYGSVPLQPHLREGWEKHGGNACDATEVGRSTAPFPASTAEARLVEAVTGTMNCSKADPDESYLQLGGSMAYIPYIVEELQRKGWFGIGVQDLAGHYSLRMLAAALRWETSP